MRIISLEECNQVAGGEGESCRAPIQQNTVIENNGPDGSFGGFVSELLGSMTAYLGSGQTSYPATIAGLGIRG